MKKNLLFFYKCSSGELHTGLPFILNILNDKKNITPFFIYENKNNFNKIPDHYKKIIYKNFNVLFLNKYNFFKFIIKHFLSRNYIFTCNSGHTTYSRRLTCCWPLSRIVFFSHGYALLGNEVDSIIRNKVKFFRARYNGYHHNPLIVAHNTNEIENRKNFGFQKENIILAGNLGYQASWMDLYADSESSDRVNKLKNKYIKTIFIPTRDAHPLYLSKGNSDYLLQSLDSIIEKNPSYLFLIKLHPRQKNLDSFKMLQEKFKNVDFIDLNTIQSAKLADLVISYWSSAITDALAVQTPTVEFHRHEILHAHLVKSNNNLISLYHHYGLCPFYQNKEDILNLLQDPTRWDEIRDKQQIKFKEIFLHEYPDFVDILFERFEKSPFKPSYFLDALKLTFLIIKNNINNFNKKRLIK